MHAVPKDLGKGRGRGERPDPQEEAEAGLYRDKDGRTGLPMLNILASMRQAAKVLRVPGRGRTTFAQFVFAGLEIEPEFIPLRIPDGRTPQEAWQVDIRPVVVQRARVLRARPRFDQWELEFTLKIMDPIIREEHVKSMLEDAGRYVGLGDLRPLMGLFQLVALEPVA